MSTKNMNVKELAMELEVSYATALGYIHKGMIKAIPKGGQWEITPQEVKRFEQEGNYKDSGKHCTSIKRRGSSSSTDDKQNYDQKQDNAYSN